MYLGCVTKKFKCGLEWVALKMLKKVIVMLFSTTGRKIIHVMQSEICDSIFCVV